MKTEIKTRINSIINDLKSSGEHITVDNIVLKSLFSSGGSLAGFEDEIKEVLWQIRCNIEKSVKRQNKDCNIVGFDIAFAVNIWFNDPKTKQILTN